MTDSASTKKHNASGLTALVMAGGTGGHIFPGLAVAQELTAKGWTIHWLGSKGGMEEGLVGKQNIPLSLIAISGLRGNGVLGWLKAPFSLFNAVLEARRVIKKVSPQVVLGFGGFASGPGGIAARLTKKYLVIHEQNAIAGLTNRMLAKLADRVFQAFPDTFERQVKAITIGNPIRKEIALLSTRANDALSPEINLNVTKQKVAHNVMINHDDKTNHDQKVKVLVIGGSRGAQALNRKLPAIFSEQLQSGKIKVRHQSGEAGYEEACASYAKLEINDAEAATVERFIDDMSSAYQWADVVICRAGALTVSEISAAGKAAIFIPFPFAVDDHQTKNANWLVEQQAGMLIQQSRLSALESQQIIQALLDDPKRIKEMANRAREIAFLDAAEKIAQACEESVEMAA